jgi:hypothetical protein
MESSSALWISLAAMVLSAVLIGLGVWSGYWMARNAMDKPVRSPHNPARTSGYVAPVEEPDGDDYADAMTRMPTIKEEGR